MRLRFIMPVVVVALATALWFNGDSTARQLQARLDALGAQRREFLRLEADRNRLQAAIDALGRTNAKQEVVEALPTAKTIVAPAPFTLGEWTSCADWSNRGQSTPRATVATALWAAAGGDVITMQALLELDPNAQTKAEALLAQLSPAARSTYVTPEALIANVTMRNIPLTQAQISWYREIDDDHATVGLLFGSWEHSAASETKVPPGKVERSPANLFDARTSKMALLNLKRSGSGWKLVVPASAIDRIAAEIGFAKNSFR